MSSDAESLNALDGLMTEFFDHRTTNDRKRQIEELLNNFAAQRDAWKACLYFMANTSNEYVMMYCMNVLESLINHQWVGFQGTDKMEIRSTLNTFLMSHHQQVPSYIRNKLAKLVVDIGRLDWPHFYPDFFSNILQLVQQNETVVLGLILLHTTSEELACPREDLSVSRKEELHKLLLQQIPTVLTLLNNILSSILEKHRSMVTATPPPSPTQGRSQTALSRSPMNTTIISSSPIQPGYLSNMFKSSQNRVQTESLLPLDSAANQVASLALNCLSHLFSWIPLSSTITPDLLNTIFHYAAFGCEVSPASRVGGVSSLSSPAPTAAASLTAKGHNASMNGNFGADGSNTLGVVAMNCINELLAKNCVPQEFESYLLQMFQQTFSLLQRVTKDSTTTSSGNRLAELDENYIEKFTEFLRLFVSIHFRRFESNKHFPVIDFLTLLFRYTFKQPSHEGLYNCLDTWFVFLDYLATSRSGDMDKVIAKYQEALTSLVTEIMHKVQFRFNQSQLDELDDETLDDDSETEWQHFLRQCLETIAKVAELLPAQTFTLVYQPFQETLEVYLGLEQYVTNGDQGRRLGITGENQCRRLHCTLRDLSSLLQALGRFSEHFIGEKFEDGFSDAKTLVDRLVYTAAYGTRLKLYEVGSMAGNVLQGDFGEVHAQALAAVKAHASWLAQYQLKACTYPQQQEHWTSLINTLVETLVPLFNKGVPEKVSQSAAHLLMSLFVTVRPSLLLQHPQIQDFYNAASQGSLHHFSMEVQLLVYRSLSNGLLLPWPSCSDGEQEWSTRAAHHKSFLLQLTCNFHSLKNTAGLGDNKALQAAVKPCVKKTLQVLTDLVQSISVDGVSRSKQICYQSLQEDVHTSLVLFPIYINQTDVTDDLLGFFLALFQGLRVQMGVPFTEQTIQTFLSMFTSEQLSEIILQESSTGCMVVEKFLKILQVIVQEPGAAFKAFLPNIIAISMNQIYPIIAERPSPDIKPMLYCLLHQLLLHNWRYFFKGTVITALKSPNDEMEHQQQFVTIMQAFGQSFLQPDIAIFRQNLEALDSLNMKWKLFSKKIFSEMMLTQFLSVLLQVLVRKSHDLLQDEIGIMVYNMASVDFERFYGAFLPQFLTECEGVDNNQKAILAQNFKLDKDLPSFTQSVRRFINDLRFYRICNNSLPEGSVKL